ncbi:GntR family transcriptional regulator [Sinomonas cyclohexanicum]|uniref:GntR family transcriptional regulator n=1 Tax=Sinomonas cyclohexanicum TaxID=322009 RepID=A0ABN6FID3_SINCY|nr:GntR family transcriptional regulator [Corynebacterium cyclohexanicum]BCT76619.1 GntR family transcriptional regulator [Corynebacterium cyclohexanicum]
MSTAAHGVSAPPGERSASKSELAYEWLHEQIVTGALEPGARLVLSQVADKLDVSVVPVREAVRRLEAEGLVTFEKNVGATVAGIDPTEYLYTMQTLSLVEGAATALSAPSITAEDIAAAREVNERMRVFLAPDPLHFDPVVFTALNREFHSVLFEHCPNPHILDLVHRGWNRLKALRGSTFSYVPERATESIEEHEALLSLIETGAPTGEIELAARRHRSATLEAYLAHTGENPGFPTL